MMHFIQKKVKQQKNNQKFKVNLRIKVEILMKKKIMIKKMTKNYNNNNKLKEPKNSLEKSKIIIKNIKIASFSEKSIEIFFFLNINLFVVFIKVQFITFFA